MPVNVHVTTLPDTGEPPDVTVAVTV